VKFEAENVLLKVGVQLAPMRPEVTAQFFPRCDLTVIWKTRREWHRERVMFRIRRMVSANF